VIAIEAAGVAVAQVRDGANQQRCSAVLRAQGSGASNGLEFTGGELACASATKDSLVFSL
jgi:hypothetical protein